MQPIDEHMALLTCYGEVQKRCTRLIVAHESEIERLRADLMQVRAAVIVRDSAFAMLREDLAAFKVQMPGLPKRIELARQLASQTERVQQLQRECAELRQRIALSSSPAGQVNASDPRADLRERAVL